MMRGAVVGLGNIARRGHLPAFTSDPGLRAAVSIAAAVDVTAAGTADPAGLPSRLYPDLESLLQSESLDFVDICSPPHTHAGVIETCASAGLHILCEKPLANRRDAVAVVGHAVRKAGVVFVPCHQYKHAPLWTAIRDCIRAGGVGRVTSARFEVLRMQADHGHAGWNPAWRTHRDMGGGGVLADTGSHYFYLTRWLFGMPGRVTSVLRTLRHHQYGVEDTAAVTLEYPEHIVHLGLTWAAGMRANAVTVAGTEGTLVYDGARLVHATPAGTREIPIGDVSDKSQYVSWYAALGREFVRRMLENDRSPDLLEEAEAVMALLDTAYRAGEERRTLDVAPGTP